MDEKRSKLKKFIESSDISEDLKLKELTIVDDWDLMTPEVEIALAKLIASEFDKKMTDAGITDTVLSKETKDAFAHFESESEMAQKDLGDDMRIVEDSLKAIRETSEEIQKVALQASLAGN